MSARPRSLSIVGAGIAGLATAIAARRAGCEVAVHEREDGPSTDGAVMLLWPNGVKAAAALGIRDALLAAGTVVRRTTFEPWDGPMLWELEVDRFEERYGHPAVLVSRRDLVDILAKAAAAEGVLPVYSAPCSGFDAVGLRVAPRIDPSVPAPAATDGLVACDGRRSAVRRQLRPKEKERPAHHTAWIGLSHATASEWNYAIGHTVSFLGRGLRLCASTMKNPVPNPVPNPVAEAGPDAPAGTRLVYWYATEAVTSRDQPRRARVDRMVELFHGVSPDAARLIRAARANPTLPPRAFDVADLAPVRSWSSGVVTLAGDAAHPSTPDLGQGACQALESAVVLGRCLARHADLATAFLRYERARLDRTARVTEMSRLTALQSMARGPMIETVREIGIRLALPTITAAEFHRLFSVDFGEAVDLTAAAR